MIHPFDDEEYFLKELAKALADMPRIVKEKTKAYKKKKKFLKKVWGAAIKQLEKEMAEE